MQRLSLLLAATVLFAVLLVAGCSDYKQPNPTVSAPPPAVTVVKVTAAEIKPTTTFTGRIEAKNKVDLRARVDGFLDKRLFTEGADVAEDELLFVIEKGLYQAAVDQAKAALETAESTLKLADGARERFRAVMMTSFAFIASLVPLVIATGAGQLSRRGVGTAVFSGMIAASFLGVFLIPLLYVVFQRLREGIKRQPAKRGLQAGAGAKPEH
jgi:multidrug efflux pump subunit AcrA (membrane-fusion protein)